VLQGVLGKPLGKALGSRYKVTGSWEKPEITLVAKEAPHTAPTAPRPADATPEAPPDAAAKPARRGLR